jgi:hypothetical protein
VVVEEDATSSYLSSSSLQPEKLFFLYQGFEVSQVKL